MPLNSLTLVYSLASLTTRTHSLIFLPFAPALYRALSLARSRNHEQRVEEEYLDERIEAISCSPLQADENRHESGGENSGSGTRGLGTK